MGKGEVTTIHRPPMGSIAVTADSHGGGISTPGACVVSPSPVGTVAIKGNY
jgi:hypothetical protein